MKNAILVAIVVLLVASTAFLVFYNTKDTTDSRQNTPEETTVAGDEAGRRMNPEFVPEEIPLGKLKVANFTGKLEKVDVGCFADGECYVEVGGKHVTAVMGWSREIVGSVQGVEGFGDLEKYIGQEVEVYAQDKGDGTYTLYGSEGFYIKLLSAAYKETYQITKAEQMDDQYYITVVSSANPNGRAVRYPLSPSASIVTNTTMDAERFYNLLTQTDAFTLGGETFFGLDIVNGEVTKVVVVEFRRDPNF